jgi:hypothetical protein
MEWWSTNNWSDGVMEYWSNESETQHSTTPSLQYSNFSPR